MTVTVMTSCSKAGWQQYGQAFLDGYHKFWPRELELHIVSEDELPISKSIMRARPIVVWNLLQSHEKARAFYERHAKNPKAHGRSQKQANTYSFRHDAVKFSKKVFAVQLVADCLVGGKVNGHLIWIDADVVSFAAVPLEMLQRMPPSMSALACLDRGRYHSECGFIGYNLDHPKTHDFISSFANLYTSDDVFALQEWHDSWTFDWLRKRKGMPCFHIPHKSQGHPFVHSELGKYMDHLKGKRKDMGVSHDHPKFRTGELKKPVSV